jgi:serine/threonine-protein kinase
VAVKFLLPSLSKDKELVARFVAEARAVNAIGHRGIVDIFNFRSDGGRTQYFVMEFLEGRPFDQGQPFGGLCVICRPGTN